MRFDEFINEKIIVRRDARHTSTFEEFRWPFSRKGIRLTNKQTKLLANKGLYPYPPDQKVDAVKDMPGNKTIGFGYNWLVFRDDRNKYMKMRRRPDGFIAIEKVNDEKYNLFLLSNSNKISVNTSPPGRPFKLVYDTLDSAVNRLIASPHFTAMEMDMIIDGIVERDRSFLTTDEFKELASRDLKDKYPEAGVDFGFFNEEYTYGGRGHKKPQKKEKKVEPRGTTRYVKEKTVMGQNYKIVEYVTDKGKLHRKDGPAKIEYIPATDHDRILTGKRNLKWVPQKEEWYYDGKLHRVDGPAKVEYRKYRRFKDKYGRPHESEGWYYHGLPHRVDGPALINMGNFKEYWAVKGKKHRIGGPAVIKQNGDEEWCVNGKYHRVGGPAVINSPDGMFYRNKDYPQALDYYWYNDGKWYEPEPSEMSAWLEKQIVGDPQFVLSDTFKKYASDEMKLRHAYGGTDFGFFDD